MMPRFLFHLVAWLLIASQTSLALTREASTPASSLSSLASGSAQQSGSSPIAGLYYLRARYLNAANGRFWNADIYEGAKRDPESLHKYLYANGDPTNGCDPSGHWSIVSVTASVAIAAVVVTGVVYAYHKYYTLNPDRNQDAAYAVTVIPHLPFVMYGPLYYRLSRPAKHVIEMHELQHVDGMSGGDESHQIIAQQMKLLIEDILVNGSWGKRPLTDEEIVDLMQVWLLHDQADDHQSIKQNTATHLETKIEIRAPGLWGRRYKNDWEAAEEENYSQHR